MALFLGGVVSGIAEPPPLPPAVETPNVPAQHRLTFDIGDSAHPIAYSMASDGESGSSGSGIVEIDSEKEVPGFIDDSVFTIRYSFQNGGQVLLFNRSEIPWPAIPGKPQGFALWMKGDGLGLQTRVRFRDSTGQIFQSDAGKIDWKGWRLIKFSLQPTVDRPLVYWNGANDGVIHYPIRWETPLLLDNVSRQAQEGEIAISMPTLID